MGFEASQVARMQAEEYHDSSPKKVDSKKSVSSRHRHSKSSDPNKRVEEEVLEHSPIAFHLRKLDVRQENGQTNVKKESSPDAAVRSSLEKEIFQLEKRLKDQVVVRHALEKAMGHSSSTIDTSNDNLMPKPTKELIREIAVLEVEVMYLEQHLLSLYRKAFDQQVSTPSPPIMKRSKPPIGCQSWLFQEVPVLDFPPDKGNLADQSSQTLLPRRSTANPVNESGVSGCPEKLTGPGVNRSHSALSQRSVCSGRMSPQAESLAKALRLCHSQPLSFLEHGQNATSEVISLAEYLGTRISDHVPETPNKLSEDLIKCMGSIYCKLVDCPLVYPGLSSSPTSSFSSMSAFSPQYLGDTWSPSCRKDSSRDARLENPFRVEGLKEFSGPYNAMIEVPSICRENLRLSDVEDMLLNYKALCRRLESVDPRKMKNQEKLAFWVNIHNALVMHAYLDYGIPQNNIKRASLLLKATCNIGGRTINAYTIQSFILRCRTHLPGKWLRALLSPRLKFKAGDEWQGYAVEHPEPFLHFALCSGSYSDPAVRIYTAKRVFQELEVAKEEYLRAAVSIHKEQKIRLPKIIESFVKDSSLSVAGIVDMIEQYLPETLRLVMQRCQQGRSQKSIEWVPHNLAFRYLLSRELIDPEIN